VTVIQLGYWEAQDRLYQGTFQTLDNPSFATYIQSNIETAVNIAHSDGGNVILETSPYFSDGTPPNLVNDFNNIVRGVVAQDSSFVSLLDVNQILDPNGAYAAIIDGVLARTPDGVHVTEPGVQVAIDPPLDNLITPTGNQVYFGNS
jgi:hypothetical protein